MPPKFIPGLKLSELFYVEAVRPVLAANFPRLRYSAARLDTGSDVLGFDTPRSTDHDWGPRLTLHLRQRDLHLAGDISRALSEGLPVEVAGYPTNFARDESSGTRWLQAVDHGPLSHWVTVTTAAGFFRDYVGFDPTRAIPARAWLAVPPQRLRTIASGRVFHDGLCKLARAREALSWYPRDVWLYLLACQWRRIDQEEPFMARCGEVGDELGSRIVAARLVNEIVRLCFLMERSYAPYTKWLGTAFAGLACAPKLVPIFSRVLSAETWHEREKHLSSAYFAVTEMHNALGLTPPLAPEASSFHERPYLVPRSSRFVDSIREQIRSEEVRRWPPYVGSVAQFADSTDVLDSIPLCRRLARAAGLP